jgi:hypothetical protein
MSAFPVSLQPHQGPCHAHRAADHARSGDEMSVPRPTAADASAVEKTHVLHARLRG